MVARFKKARRRLNEMIPIRLDEKSVENIRNGKYKLVFRNKGQYEVGELVQLNLAFNRKLISREGYLAFRKNMLERGFKMEVKDYELDDVIERLTPEEQVFFILYNSKNYVDERFGIGTYLNDIVSYMIAFLNDNELVSFGQFLKEDEVEELKEEFDLGMDQQFSKFNLRVGLFKFRDSKCYTVVKSRALKVRKRESIKEANKRLVETFCGDDMETRQKVIKGIMDTFETTKNEKIRLEAGKLLGEWFGIENKATNSSINLLMGGINTAYELEKALKETENKSLEESKED